MNYQQIKKQAEQKTNQLLNDCRVFWAFSDQQFEEGKIKIGFRVDDPEEKLSRINGGGFVPSSLLKKLLDGMKEINKWEREEIKKDRQNKHDQIVYELYNHECFYTGDISDACAVLPYPKKDVYKVYLQEKAKGN